MGLTLLLCWMTAIVLVAQDSLLIRQTDSITYRQYLDGDYRALIETSRSARDQGVTFYYLDYRTAIAYDALKNHAAAATFYERALAVTPDDALLQESLYYALLLSGQQEKAHILAASFAPHTQAVTGYHTKAVDRISLAGGYLMNENDRSIAAGSSFDSLNQYGDMAFTSLGIDFNLSLRSRLKLGYQFYNTRFERSAGGGLLREEQLAQHQLVAALEFFTPGSITWGFAGGYYNIEQNNGSSATLPGNGWGGPGPGGSAAAFTSAPLRSHNYSVTAFLARRFRYTLPEIAFSWSDFGWISQYQAKGSLTYYPLGNLNFYGTTAAALIHTPGGWTTHQYLFSQQLGFRLFGQLWTDTGASIGNHLNYISDRSFTVYDTYDPVMATASVTLSWYARQMRWSAGYGWQQKEGYAWTTTDYETYRYNNHLINIAWSWNF